MSDAHYIFKYHLEIGLKYFTCFLDGQAIAIKLSNQISKVVMAMKKCLNSLNRMSHENLVFETIKDPKAAIYQPTAWQLESLFHSGRCKEKSDKFDFYERQVQRGNSDNSQRNGKPCQF